MSFLGVSPLVGVLNFSSAVGLDLSIVADAWRQHCKKVNAISVHLRSDLALIRNPEHASR